MRATTLCGSDLHYFTYYRNGDIQIREPLTPGHECAGVVAAVGQNAARDYGLTVGDRVAVEVGVPCGDCDQCSDGTYNVCGKLRFRSSATAFPHYQGTLQERFNHPARWVHKSVTVLISPASRLTHIFICSQVAGFYFIRARRPVGALVRSYSCCKKGECFTRVDLFGYWSRRRRTLMRGGCEEFRVPSRGDG